MQRLLTGLVALALVVSPATAEANNGGTEAEKSTATATADRPENSAKSDAVAKPESPSMEVQLGQLRSLLEAQAEELKAQHAALLEQQKKMDALEEQLRAARAVNGVSTEAGAAVLAPAAGSSASLAAATPMTAAQEKKKDEPITAIHYKGITITPGGFLDASSVWRQRALSADVNTPFNSAPFPGSSQSKVSEFNASGRASRFTLLVEGKLSSAKLTGYYEQDWLSAGTTSNSNQSNSYTNRLRQIWGQAGLNSGWTFTGGQMWSLLTERKKAIDNRTEAVTLTIDHQYNVGFSWARQYGFRVTKSFNDKLWLAFSVENAQTTFGGRGFSTNTDAKKNVTTNFFLAAPGAGGGLFNATANYSLNKTPDFVVKAAIEPGWGHYEIFGVISTFRSRIFPCAVVDLASTTSCLVGGVATASAAGARNDSRTGGGLGVNLRVPVFNKKLDIGAHFFGGDGIGRYGTAGLPDATARPDGTLALIRGAQALGTLEWHPTSMLDVYANFGVEYAYRTQYAGYTTVDLSGATPVVKTGLQGGYGNAFFNNSGCSTELTPSTQNSPSSAAKCAGDTKNILQGTLGYWHYFYKGEKGKLAWGAQYSYFVRDAWSGNNNTAGVPGVTAKGIDNMVLTSFRYYLP